MLHLLDDPVVISFWKVFFTFLLFCLPLFGLQLGYITLKKPLSKLINADLLSWVYHFTFLFLLSLIFFLVRYFSPTSLFYLIFYLVIIYFLYNFYLSTWHNTSFFALVVLIFVICFYSSYIFLLVLLLGLAIPFGTSFVFQKVKITSISVKSFLIYLSILFLFFWILILVYASESFTRSVSANDYFLIIINFTFCVIFCALYYFSQFTLDKLLKIKKTTTKSAQENSFIVSGAYSKQRFLNLTRKTDVNYIAVCMFRIMNYNFIQSRIKPELIEKIYQHLTLQLKQINPNPNSFLFLNQKNSFVLFLPIDTCNQDVIIKKINQEIYSQLKLHFIEASQLIKIKLKIGISIYNYHAIEFWKLINYAASNLNILSNKNVSLFNYQQYFNYHNEWSKFNYLMTSYGNATDSKPIFDPVVEIASKKILGFQIGPDNNPLQSKLTSQLHKQDLYQIFLRVRLYEAYTLLSNILLSKKSLPVNMVSKPLIFLNYPIEYLAQDSFDLNHFVQKISAHYFIANVVLIFNLKDILQCKNHYRIIQYLHDNHFKIAIKIDRNFEQLDVLANLRFENKIKYIFTPYRVYNNLLIYKLYNKNRIIIHDVNSKTTLQSIINQPLLASGKYFDRLE